jgi:hypothetical protein
MDVIGEQSKRNEIFMPEMMIAARAMHAGLDILEPILGQPLIDLAIAAEMKGLQCMEPMAGNDLGRIKEEYGDRLVLLGNLSSTEVLTQKDPP